jgi:methionyl-tRNA synthetase
MMLDKLNKYADETQPWITIKNDQITTTHTLYTLAEGLRQVGLHLYPFFPEKMSEMFTKLGLSEYQEILESGGMTELQEKQEAFKITEKGEALFQREEI